MQIWFGKSIEMPNGVPTQHKGATKPISALGARVVARKHECYTYVVRFSGETRKQFVVVLRSL
jgi:hypothetical protein